MWHEKDNPSPKIGGGISLYIKSSIVYSLSDLEALNCSSPDIEIIWIKILNPKHRDYLIGTTYRPPQGSPKEFARHIENSLNQITNLDKIDVFILGDMNINYADPKNPGRKHIKRLEDLFGMKQLIKDPTRISPRLSSTIDLILTNSLHILNSGVLHMNISDHDVIFVNRKKKKERFVTTFIDARSYVHYDKQDFQNQLLQQDWAEYYTLDTVDEIWDCFLTHVSNVADTLCPTKKIKIKDKPEQDPWITHEILEMIQDKIRFQKLALVSKDIVDIGRAKAARNETKAAIKNARLNYIKDNLEIHRHDPQKFWKQINNLIPNNENSKDIYLINDADGSEVKKSGVAGFINEYFTNIGPSLAVNMTTPWTYDGEMLADQIPEIVTTPDEVFKLCKDIEIHKSSSVTNISSRLLKDAFLVLSHQLAFLLNRIFHTATIPNLWKQAKITPLYKGGDRTNVSNYRPISVLPLPGKSMEKIIHNRLTGFLRSS